MLKTCAADAERDPAVHPIAGARLKDMLAFVQMMDIWYAQMLTVPKSRLASVVRLGTRIFSFLPSGKKK